MENEKMSLREKAILAEKQIDQGEKTLNQIRIEFGLEPVDDESFNTLYIKV